MSTEGIILTALCAVLVTLSIGIVWLGLIDPVSPLWLRAYLVLVGSASIVGSLALAYGFLR